MKNILPNNIMILLINNSENNLFKTTWNLKAFYVIRELIGTSNSVLVNSKDEMNNIIADKALRKKIKGIILTGSELRINNKLYINKIMDNVLPILELDVPVLAICFGMQVIGSIYQSKFSSFDITRKGHVKVNLNKRYKIFDGINKDATMFVEHNDWLKNKPILFDIIATSYDNIIYGIKHKFKPIYGLQFHPEFSNISDGIRIYENFLGICGIKHNDLEYDDILEVEH